MKRFIEGEARTQVTLLPECLDDYVTEENPVRVVDVAHGAFGSGLQNHCRLSQGQRQSHSQRLPAIRSSLPQPQSLLSISSLNLFSQSLLSISSLNLFSQSIIAIDGSKFKAVNNRDRNFTQGKVKARMQQIEQSIDRYLVAMDSADRATPELAEAKAERLKEKIETLKKQMQKLKDIEAQLHDSPDQQISLTDPDARSMATSGRGTGTVGYNVQTAVDDKHHLIIAHEVTNVGNDRTQLSNMANQAREEIGAESLTVVADRGYYKGLEILACEQAGINTFVPKPLTSGSKAEGRRESSRLSRQLVAVLAADPAQTALRTSMSLTELIHASARVIP
jgi:hypothetical protein